MNIVFIPCFFPIFWGQFSVEPNETMILEAFGKPIKEVSTPGLKYSWPVGIRKRKVATAL